MSASAHYPHPNGTLILFSVSQVLVNVISGGLTPSFTCNEAERSGAKIIIFSLVSCVAAVHGIRAAMRSLKTTGTDFASAQGMDPKAFFQVMGALVFLGGCFSFWTNGILCRTRRCDRARCSRGRVRV
jgi:hypothetical protein